MRANGRIDLCRFFLGLGFRQEVHYSPNIGIGLPDIGLGMPQNREGGLGIVDTCTRCV